jgi:hypothetical protein
MRYYRAGIPHLALGGMKKIGRRPDKSTNDHHKKEEHPSTSLLAASVPTYQITLHSKEKCIAQFRYVD